MALFEKFWDDIPYNSVSDAVGVLSTPVVGDALTLHKGARPATLLQRYTGTGNARKIAFWAGGTAIQNGEIACLFGWKSADPDPFVTGNGLVMRASGAANVLNCYGVVRLGNNLRLLKYVTGTAITLSEIDMGAAFWNTDLIMKLQCNGSTIQAKAWTSGTPEPDWMLTATDTSIPGTGVSGIFSFIIPLDLQFGQLRWTSAGEALPPMEYAITGNVREDDAPNPDVPLIREVRAARRANRGRAHFDTTSLADGSFRIVVPTPDEYTVYVLDELAGPYNALISDRIIPVAV